MSISTTLIWKTKTNGDGSTYIQDGLLSLALTHTLLSALCACRKWYQKRTWLQLGLTLLS